MGLGRRGNLCQVERVATSSGKANVVSGVGKLPARPDHHHLDLDPLQTPVIVHGTTAVSFAHGAFMLQTTRVTTSASSSHSSPVVVVTAGTLKHGGYQSVVPTTLQQKVRAKPRRSPLATSSTFQTHNQSWIRRSRQNYRRRCERR